MDSTLEQQRRYHEERERIVDAMVKESLVKSSTNREVINSDHRLRYLRDRYMTATERVKELYEDKDSRDEEKATMSGSNALTEFYNRLRVIRDFHRKHPNEISVPMSVEFEDIAKQRESNEDSGVLVDFTDEEGYGKYLDLHESYNKFINLKGVSRVDYITYLATFDHLYEIPKERKTGQYKEYLTSLIDYLWGYVERLKPLLDLDAEMNVATTKFEEQWEAGKFPGWSRETGGALTSLGAHLDLSAFSSSEELMSLGLDRLKSALMALNLKCGGTLEERARRLFSTKGKSLNSVEPSLFARNRGSGGPIGPPTAANEKMRETATLEMQVYRLSEILTDQRMATRENVQRRQARREGEQEDSDEDAVLSDSDSDIDVDEEAPYNPKNLPLGWDGKPIPYWLYKLHGLNISYKCEICGNFVYKGPKAFQRHFAEWRHAHGMRCLGVPNTAHFANVTRIDEALELWQKLKAQKANERFVAEADEEFEDSLGNVVNRKTFDDLKRQGLL